jgi:hypothetical protein
MSQDVSPIEFHINIKQLRLTSFKIVDIVDMPSPELLKVGMQQVIQTSLPDLTLSLELKVSFSNQEDVVLLEAVSKNVFSILELPLMMAHGSTDRINIPDNIMVTLLSISISHTRALMSQASLGSKFQDILLPIVDPQRLKESMVPV